MTTPAIQNKCQPGPTRRLLLVDDDEAMRDVLCETLQGWSFAPTTAGTFREARDVVATTAPFTVIVSDYHLPDGTGLEFFDWLKREMALKVPFLLISGGMAKLPVAAENFEFLAKPFLMHQLHDRLEKLNRPQLQASAADYSAPTQRAAASVYALKKP